MTREAPNSLLLHQYHLGELDGEELARVKQAIEQDPETRRRYQAVQAAETSFALQSLPPWAQQAAPSVPWWRRILPVAVPMAGLAAVAAAVLIVVGLPGSQPAPFLDGTGADTVTLKGELPELEVWVGTEGGARPLKDGETLSAGSHVNLVFDAHGARFATLAGQDGTGTVEVYGTVETAGREGLVEAPFGLVLDEAPGPQVFYVLGHDEPLPEEVVKDHVRQGTGDLIRVQVDKD